MKTVRESLGAHGHGDTTVKILILIQTLIQKFNAQTERYAEAISETMMIVFASSSVFGTVKEIAVRIMQKLVDNDQYKHGWVLVSGLLNIRSEKKASPKLLQLTYELLGQIGGKYPDRLQDDYDIQISELFLKTLENTLLIQQGYSPLSLCGVLNGFTY